MALPWVLLIAGCGVAALPALDEAPKLTLDELVGAGTFAPPTLAPDATTTDWGIPPNPEAWKPNPVKGIPLPVFDPTVKWEGPPAANENRDRFIPMPEGSFHIEFDKDHPPQEFNLSEPIHVDLSKYISDKFECGFCIKIVEALKKEIQMKGVQKFTDDLQKSCQSQKDSTPAQAQTNCNLIEKVKVERLATESVESICLSEKRCKDQAAASYSIDSTDKDQELFPNTFHILLKSIAEGNKHMEELAIANKEEDEMREKWKKENERNRQIVEAQEEKWRRDFKRTHNDTMEPFKPFLVNLPEGFDESTVDNWKPDFGGWNVENETTTTAASVDSATVALAEEGSGAEEETAMEKKTENPSESAPSSSGAKFKPIENVKPTIDFVHEVLEQTVQKEEPATFSLAGSPLGAMAAAKAEEAVEASSTAASVDGVTPSADEAGPEPTTLFATTEATEHFTKSAEEKAGEEQARRTLQTTILEAKKAVDEDVGFMSKPVVPPNRDGAAWANGPRVNLHEFVSDHHLGTASSPKATVDAASLEKAPETASVEPTISPPVRAPIQCNPPTKASNQFSAHPTTGQSSDAAPESASAAAAAEPEATKLEVAAEQEGPAKMAIPKNRAMRASLPLVANRVVQVQFSVDDIAK